MSDELMLISSFDQSVSADTSWVFDQIDQKIRESVEKRSAFIALNICRELKAVGQVAGLGLAKTLYQIKQNWENYDDVGDNFEDTISDYAGINVRTVERYIRVWKMKEDNIVPKELEKDIFDRNIKEIIPIANAINQGYEIEDDEWQELADAPDLNTVGGIMRDIKGQPPRKSALQIVMDRDGTLNAIQAGEFGYVGFLNVDEDNEVAQKAIARLVSSGGIIKR